MEPILILVPGLIGGLVLAMLLASRRKRTPSIVVSRPLAAPSPVLINMAHIPVDGVGGLGLVAAVIAVAVTDPRIRLAIIIAAVLGTGLAWLLIAIRRRTGGMPWTGSGPNQPLLLRIDGDRPSAKAADPLGPGDRLERPRSSPFQTASPRGPIPAVVSA